MLTSPGLKQVFADCQLFALEQQLRLADVLDGPWTFDMGAGAVLFDLSTGRRTVPVQILGTEGHGAGTWMWSWANGASGIPSAMTTTAEELRDFGQAKDLPEFTERTVALEAMDGHLVATVASALAHQDSVGYYRCPYDGGAMFVLLCDPELNPKPPRPLLRLLTVLPQVVHQLTHILRSVYGYAYRHGLAFDAHEEGCRVSGEEGTVLVKLSDDDSRLLGMEGDLHPS